MSAPVKQDASGAVASRDAFGDALVRLGETHPELVVLEADLSESTRSMFVHTRPKTERV